MSSCRILGALIVLIALLDCVAQAQTAAEQPKRREGEIWFEGERGHLMVRIPDRLEREPVTVTITEQRTKKPIDAKVGKMGLQFLIMRDLGDTNDLPIFPLWFYTMDKGDYSILKRFVERLQCRR